MTDRQKSILARADPAKRERWLAAVRIANAKPRSAEHRAKLGAAQRASWASGQRKPTPRSAYEKASATTKRRWLDGEIFQKRKWMTSEEARCYRAKVNPEKLRAANRLLGEQRRGMEMAPITKRGAASRGAKGTNHWCAKWWAIEHHDGTRLEGKNLNELIRCNAGRFNPEDVVWKRSNCRASKGIRQLFEGRVNGPKVWKGWSACDLLPPKLPLRISRPKPAHP